MFGADFPNGERVIDIQFLKHVVIEFRGVGAGAKVNDEINLMVMVFKPRDKFVPVNQ